MCLCVCVCVFSTLTSGAETGIFVVTVVTVGSSIAKVLYRNANPIFWAFERLVGVTSASLKIFEIDIKMKLKTVC